MARGLSFRETSQSEEGACKTVSRLVLQRVNREPNCGALLLEIRDSFPEGLRRGKHTSYAARQHACWAFPGKFGNDLSGNRKPVKFRRGTAAVSEEVSRHFATVDKSLLMGRRLETVRLASQNTA